MAKKRRGPDLRPNQFVTDIDESFIGKVVCNVSAVEGTWCIKVAVPGNKREYTTNTYNGSDLVVIDRKKAKRIKARLDIEAAPAHYGDGTPITIGDVIEFDFVQELSFGIVTDVQSSTRITADLIEGAGSGVKGYRLSGITVYLSEEDITRKVGRIDVKKQRGGIAQRVRSLYCGFASRAFRVNRPAIYAEATLPEITDNFITDMWDSTQQPQVQTAEDNDDESMEVYAGYPSGWLPM
jgi:hypothetical protein